VPLLLDTHVFLWWLKDDRRLGPTARAQIAARRHTVFVSAASAWEIAVKRAGGRLEAPGDITEWIAGSEFTDLSISVAHAVGAAELPPHHHDPFDRLLIAQARIERLTLVSADAEIGKYDVDVLRAES
jgi:PIN domain nuclease of toxin-antitoxin system